MKDISRRQALSLFGSGLALSLSSTVAIADASGNADFDVSFAERNEARAVAEKILAHLDEYASGSNVDLGVVYKIGGSALRARYSLQQMAIRIRSVRVPLAAVLNRKLYAVSGGFRELPNLPSGRYVIVMFDSVFSNKKVKSEEVTLEQKSQGSDWTFVEYYVGPKGVG